MSIKYTCSKCGAVQSNASLVCSICEGGVVAINLDVLTAMMWEEKINNLPKLVFDNVPFACREAVDYRQFSFGTYEL